MSPHYSCPHVSVSLSTTMCTTLLRVLLVVFVPIKTLTGRLSKRSHPPVPHSVVWFVHAYGHFSFKLSFYCFLWWVCAISVCRISVAPLCELIGWKRCLFLGWCPVMSSSEERIWFAVPLCRPNHLWRRKAAVSACVCVVGQHVIVGFWGLIKECKC